MLFQFTPNVLDAVTRMRSAFEFDTNDYETCSGVRDALDWIPPKTPKFIHLT